jgi:hypothetical protein
MNARPDWLSEQDAEWGPSYLTIIKSFPDLMVLEHGEFGSYQGDEAALVSHPTLGVGLTVWGYGSCSGCDALQATMTEVGWNENPSRDDREGVDWTPLVELREEMHRNIHWEPEFADLKAWVEANPGNHWWSYDAEVAGWINAHLGTSLKEEDDY